MPPIPPELMQVMGSAPQGPQGAGGPGGQGGAPQGAPESPAGGPGAGGASAGAPGGNDGGQPGAAPMSTPQEPYGEKQNAMVNVSLAMDLLERSLVGLGSESEEGREVLKVLTTLSRKFGAARSQSQDLVPAELAQLMGALPQMGGMSPEAKAMGQQPIQIPGMPGGAPGGQPMPPMPGAMM